MPFMPPTDSMFLLVESREHPMHVGGLQLFEPPEGAGPEFVRDLIASFRAEAAVNPVFRKRPADPVSAVGNTWWTYDDAIDVEYHVRHDALPEPRRIRELLAATSLWHSSLLDRHRPLWECHVVEGLNDGRFAIYSKVHHSIADGVSAMRLLQRSLSTDPDERELLPPWLQPAGQSRSRDGDEQPRSGGVNALTPWRFARSVVGAASDIAGDVAGLLPTSMRIAAEALGSNELTLPRAPRTMFNVPIGGARRFAAQSWEIERIKRVAKSSATTMNDVVLAMVSGALREYLLENNALPDEPMTAMVPVSLSLRGGAQSARDGGNQVGVIIVNLATDRSNGSTRLEEIAYSARQAKRILGDLTPMQILALSALQILPLAFTPIPGFVKYTHPPFNVIVSNVPGPSEEMYLNGARLDGMYPVSIALDGQAINITLTSRSGYIDIGIVGCRRAVPHLQRMLLHLESSLAELEQSWG